MSIGVKVVETGQDGQAYDGVGGWLRLSAENRTGAYTDQARRDEWTNPEMAGPKGAGSMPRRSGVLVFSSELPQIPRGLGHQGGRCVWLGVGVPEVCPI